MSTARERVAEAICGETAAGEMFPWSTLNERDRDSWRQVADAAIAAHLEALKADGYVQPVRVTTVEELDALPADSVVMTISSRITYQRARTPGQYWYSSALNTCEAKDIGLPVLVLWTPPDHIIEQLQEVTQ